MARAETIYMTNEFALPSDQRAVLDAFVGAGRLHGLPAPLADWSGTFDIYAELGPHPDIVESVTSALESAVAEIAGPSSRVPLLFTDEIQPAGLKGRARLDQLVTRREKAIDDVVNSRPNMEEKQNILDIANRVEEGAKQEQEKSRKSITDEQEEALNRLRKPFEIWSMAIVLLGSGSEGITKGPKRKLAAQIVSATAILADELFRAFPRELFVRLRERFESDSFVRNITKVHEPSPVNDKVKELVSALIDTYELSFFTFPLRAVLANLCNAAGQPVLSQTVSSVVTTRPLDNLIARLWSAEINARQARAELLAAIRDIPPVPLVRHALYTHLMARVFWTQWEMGNQLALLDAADECIAPLKGKRLDKGRVKRRVVAAARRKKATAPDSTRGAKVLKG